VRHIRDYKINDKNLSTDYCGKTGNFLMNSTIVSLNGSVTGKKLRMPTPSNS
jgi:hypothetical protein